MEDTLCFTVYSIYIKISTIDGLTLNYIGKRWVCSVCDVYFDHESKLKRHKASERHAKNLDMLSVLEDANSSKEVPSEPFEFEELCSEDFDKVHIIIIHKYVYTQHSHTGMYCDPSSLMLHTTCEMLVDYVTGIVPPPNFILEWIP